jgi:hypothetical protein
VHAYVLDPGVIGPSVPLSQPNGVEVRLSVSDNDAERATQYRQIPLDAAIIDVCMYKYFKIVTNVPSTCENLQQCAAFGDCWTS